MRSSVFVNFLLREHLMGIVLAGADPERLYRLLRFATVHGVFKISRGSRRQRGLDATAFANNALSACLREDHPNSQKHLVSALNQSTVISDTAILAQKQDVCCHTACLCPNNAVGRH